MLFFAFGKSSVMELNFFAKPEWGTLRPPDVLYPFGDITEKKSLLNLCE
jgi:hypothetical protein